MVRERLGWSLRGSLPPSLSTSLSHLSIVSAEMTWALSGFGYLRQKAIVTSSHDALEHNDEQGCERKWRWRLEGSRAVDSG